MAKSDPVKYNFYASHDQAYRTTGWRSELRVGSYGFGDHMSFFKFTENSAYSFDADEYKDLTDNQTLSNALQTRGTVTSAKLHFCIRDTGGYGTIPSGANPYFIGHESSGNFGSGTPVFDSSYPSSLAVGGWAADAGKSFSRRRYN